jgi:hypothetical protein
MSPTHAAHAEEQIGLQSDYCLKPERLEDRLPAVSENSTKKETQND